MNRPLDRAQLAKTMSRIGGVSGLGKELHDLLKNTDCFRGVVFHLLKELRQPEHEEGLVIDGPVTTFHGNAKGLDGGIRIIKIILLIIRLIFQFYLKTIYY